VNSPVDSYDMVVIGSGPAGRSGAVTAGRLGKRVAVVDRKERLGGLCLNAGTIPSKILREAVLGIDGFRARDRVGAPPQSLLSIEGLASRVDEVLAREMESAQAELDRHGIALRHGMARFTDPHTIEIVSSNRIEIVHGDRFLIACGARPVPGGALASDGRRIFDAETLGRAERFPQDMIVVGAGVVGLEYASILAALGIRVTVVEAKPTVLDFADREIVASLCYLLRQRGGVLRLSERVVSARTEEGGVIARLGDGGEIAAGGLLQAAGRRTNADRVQVEAAGLQTDERGRIRVDEYYRTAVAHIAAAGDVIGFPALASTSTEQGRVAVCNLFGIPYRSRPEYLPFGIYTIPEISMVGRTEQDLRGEKIPYGIGIARLTDLPRARMAGAETGMLKLLFGRPSLKLLGVHAIGEGATELIHIGQAVLAFDGTIEYFRDMVFNHPTFAEAYKVAALDGLGRL
jgi:NAD(P) transhydrogenase